MERKWLDYRTTPEEVAEMDGVLSRDAYRRFKQVNRRDMAVVLARIYHFGMMDGAEQARQKAEETEEVNWDDIMDEIRKVKGIGKELSTT